MQRILPVGIATLILVSLTASAAHAYLDAGTGSMMTQLLLGGVAGLAVLIRMYWRRLLELFGRSSSASTPSAPTADDQRR